MTSVRDFTLQTSIWQQCAPMLEQAVRWANTRQVSLGTAVRSSGDPKRHSLLAELAFTASEHGYRTWVTTPKGPEYQAVSAFLARLPGGTPVARVGPVTQDEWQEIQKLASVINRFTDGVDGRVEFRPFVPGCGSVSGEAADLLAGTNLIEVKAVTRAFAPGDLRQVLTYAALRHAASDPIESVSLLNPRRARLVELPLELVAELVRGEAAVVLLDDLVEAMVGLPVSA